MVTIWHEKEILNRAWLMSLLWWVDFSGLNHNSTSPPCTPGKDWRILYLIALLNALCWLEHLWGAGLKQELADAKLTGCSCISCQAYKVKLFTFCTECVCLKSQRSDSLVQVLIVTLIWWLCCPLVISVLWFCWYGDVFYICFLIFSTQGWLICFNCNTSHVNWRCMWPTLRNSYACGPATK